MSNETDGMSGAVPAGGNEFERVPVPATHWKSLRSFLAMYAGEHVAGTEFMIGPLFLAAGVSAFDLIFGLLAGNALATLSWLFICAPVATKLRVTLYRKLEQVCGVQLVTLYNVVNGILFCILAGAMISVGVTALGVPFQLKMPGLQDWMPNSVAWVVGVVLVGAVFTYVAARGYDAMAKVAEVAAPWMIVIFLACGLVTLPALGVHSPAEFWEIAKTRIWKGGEPFPGQPKFTFWHVMFFAWTCNAAMHLGLVDMAIFRYAKKWTYGAASGVGMFIGHFMAWIAASLLLALQIARDPANTTVAPGPMAYEAVGVAGVLCVLIAGWTTANPTLYRAGLAFQSIFQKHSRFALTLVAGALATTAAIFPALVMKLLDFVGLYGTILAPMGAIVLVDVYVLERFGLTSNLAERKGLKFNLAAGLAWVMTLYLCAGLNVGLGIQVYFLAVPAWLMAGALYLLLSMFLQSRLCAKPSK